MSKPAYFELLQRPQWQKKRLEVMQRDNWTCLHCDSTDRKLAVHHRFYVKGRLPWDYPNWVFQTLCEECHEEVHNPREKDPEEAEAEITEWERIVDFLASTGDDFELTIGDFWHMAAMMNVFVKEGGNLRSLLRTIERGLDASIAQLREQKEASK